VDGLVGSKGDVRFPRPSIRLQGTVSQNQSGHSRASLFLLRISVVRAHLLQLEFGTHSGLAFVACSIYWRQLLEQLPEAVLELLPRSPLTVAAWELVAAAGSGPGTSWPLGTKGSGPTF